MVKDPPYLSPEELTRDSHEQLKAALRLADELFEGGSEALVKAAAERIATAHLVVEEDIQDELIRDILATSAS